MTVRPLMLSCPCLSRPLPRLRWSLPAPCTGSPLRRAGYERFLRNLAVGLGNAPSTIPVLEALNARRDDPSELVREHVEWALARHDAL